LKGGCVAPRCRGSVTVTVLGKDYCDVHNAARLDLAYAQRPQEGPAMRTLRLLDEEDVRTQRHGLPARGGPLALSPVRVGRGRQAPGLADLSPQVSSANLSGETVKGRATVFHAPDLPPKEPPSPSAIERWLAGKGGLTE